MDFRQNYLESQQSYVGPDSNPCRHTDTPPRRPSGHDIALGIIDTYVDQLVYETSTVWENTEHFSPMGRAYATVGTTAGTIFGVRGVSDVFYTHDAVDAHVQSWGERANDGISGAVSLGTAGFGGAKLLSPPAGSIAGLLRNGAGDAADDLVIDSYGILRRRSDISGQAHHLNQDAAYRSRISHSDGISVKLEGNAFKDVGTPHYNAHESMESFWDVYRPGGMDAGNLPTNSQYNRALYNGLQESGLSPAEALRAVRAAKA